MFFFYLRVTNMKIIWIQFYTSTMLFIVSLEWTELAVSGTLPPPRCGHTATMVEKRLLVYGGRGEILKTEHKCMNEAEKDLWCLMILILISINCKLYCFCNLYSIHGDSVYLDRRWRANYG